MASTTNSEYMLCGDAWDGDCTEKDPSNRNSHEMSKIDGGRVTCRKCLEQIRAIQDYLNIIHTRKQRKPGKL
jgi:hypothetical protein